MERIIKSSLIIAVAVGCVVTSLPGSPFAHGEEKRPNILVIFSDDQGYHDVGCYGSEIETPVLDRLALEGMRFTQFYAASSICTPSRYGLLTGRYAHRSRDQLTGALMFMADADRERGIRPGETTYVSKLGQAGYRTMLVGKWHLGHGQLAFWPTKHGFDSFYGHTGGCVDFFTLHYGNRPDWYRDRNIVETNGYATDVITREALSELSRATADQRPFYLQVSYNAPHFGKGWDEAKQQPVNVMQPKPDDLKQVASFTDPLRRAFAAKVVGLDQSIGQLLGALDQLGIADETMVIFMTDHGGDANYGGSNLPFRGGKATLYEGGIRVPCIVRWPGNVAAGTTCDEVACAVDWFATFADIADFAAEQTDGQSILELLHGQSQPGQRTLIWKTGAHEELGRKSWAAVRQGNWKWVRAPEAEGELFNLQDDPGESTDLAGSRPDKASQLRELAEQS